MQVPLLDLKAQYATIREEMMAAITEVMESQFFINGPAVKDLEADIARYCNTRHAVGVSSGTDALLVTLMALGIGRDSPASADAPPDEVITTPYTFFATAGCIWRVGAKPVFVDIDPQTYNIDVTRIEAAITERTKAIMPVHLFGQMADMAPIMALAEKYNLHVIEDAAQAIGATQNGRQAGTFGTAGCFSFFPSKNLGGLGDGGIITTNDDELAEKMRQCRNHGSKPKYYHKWVGGNFRLDTLQAAGIRVKLKYLDQWHQARRDNATFYDQALAGIKDLQTPVIRNGNISIYNQYVIRVPRRDDLREYFKQQGIGNEVYYPVPMHLQDCFKSLGHQPGDFPQSELAAQETVAIAIYPELTRDQQQHVVESLVSFYGDN